MAVHDLVGSDRRVVLLAGSFGGVVAMQEVLYGLPADFPVPILCVQHLMEGSDFVSVLERCTSMPVRWARHEDRWTARGVLVCPPGRHFVAEPSGRLSLARSQASSAISRPIDRSLVSLASVLGSGVIALVLAGSGSDGAEGVCAVRQRGGTVLAQDEQSSIAWAMPHAALRSGCVDSVVPLQDMAPLLIQWTIEETLARASQEPAALLPRDPTPMRDRTLSLHAILHQAIGAVGAQMGNVQVVRRGGEVLEVVIQRGFGPKFLEHFRSVRNDDPSVCGRAWRSRDRIIVSDVASDPLFASHARIATSAGFRAVQSTPLLDRRGEPLGMLSTHFATPRQLAPEELAPLDVHARSAAAVLQGSFEA